jgi:2-keto-4-pentenoate hydratase/2-oxohepta-3-ene-1,7-dioic acid hydratase in catechol pathway
MRIVNFVEWPTGLTPALLVGDDVVIAATAIKAAEIKVAADPIALLGLSSEARAKLSAAAAKLVEAGKSKPIAEVELGPPVTNPPKIICLGLNYRDHAAEAGLEPPVAPILFGKYSNALIGSGQPIVPPLKPSRIDYEAELAVVIGREGKDIAEKDALDYVGGYMPFNDVSDRDLQTQTTQWMAGKAIDTFGPCGPALVTADEVDDPQNLRIIARVNGEVLQDGNTKEMIFSIAQQIAFISSLMKLEPGDIIATGTPAGVGFSRKPPVLLTDGDVVEVEIEGLGVVSNPVVVNR